MKNLIIITISLIISHSIFAKDYSGKLRCWDNKNPQALIPMYFEENMNSLFYMDENNHRSFIMDFSRPLTRWSFTRRGFKVIYEWSISECEDLSKFIFRRIDLEKVLSGDLKATTLKYLYQHPDGYNIFRVLKCEKAPENTPFTTPVFNLF